MHGVGGDAAHRVLGLPYASTARRLRDHGRGAVASTGEGRPLRVHVGELTSGRGCSRCGRCCLPFTLAQSRAGEPHGSGLARVPDGRIAQRVPRLLAQTASCRGDPRSRVRQRARPDRGCGVLDGDGHDRCRRARARCGVHVVIVAALLGTSLTAARRFEGYRLGGRLRKRIRAQADPSDRSRLLRRRRPLRRRWPWHAHVARRRVSSVDRGCEQPLTDRELRSPRSVGDAVGCCFAAPSCSCSLSNGGAAQRTGGGPAGGTVSALSHLLVAGVASAVLNAIPAEPTTDDGSRARAARRLRHLARRGGRRRAGDGDHRPPRPSPYETAWSRRASDSSVRQGATDGANSFRSLAATSTSRSRHCAPPPRSARSRLSSSSVGGGLRLARRAQRVDVDRARCYAPALTALVRGIRRNAASLDRQGRIGQLWDVLSFWPRAFHPWGPPVLGEGGYGDESRSSPNAPM